MNAISDVRCPVCGGLLDASDASRLVCPARLESFPLFHGIYDLRVHLAEAVEPSPLRGGAYEVAFRAQAAGRPFREALEELLLTLHEVPADRLMQILGEGRGAWFPLLRASGGELLFLGNALSGTVTPLADAGFRVTIVDPSPERARFGALRNEAHAPGRTRTFIAGDMPRLPFRDGSFDVVVQETGFAGASPAFRHPIDDCRRVARGEVVLIGNNRLGYKRSTGRRSILYVPGPFEYAREALSPREGERTLIGWRRALSGPGWEPPQAFALYPHASDFTHVVALDARRPSLTIGPMERRNRLKLAARRLGVFPILAPSFALFTSRAGAASESPRFARVLAEVAERTSEPIPEVDQIVATRGNSAVVHTLVPGAGQDEPAGRWTLHLPLNPKNRPQTERHFRSLAEVRRRFPGVPVPEPLWHGRADGVLLACERRARGWSAPQISGDRARVARMLADVAAHMAQLVVRPAAPFSARDFDEQLGARFDVVRRHAAVPSTIAALDRMQAEARERLVGRALPRVYLHADLRAKHVQIDEDGGVIAYLDWGTAEEEGLPYHDLMNLVVHERKQEQQIGAGEAWRIVRDRTGLRDDEQAALAGYARAVGIEDDVARAIEAVYPVLVAAMAEKNWDYSRPRWVNRQFGI